MSDEVGFLGDPPEETDTKPLARLCSLCGQGYHPTFTIDISDSPRKGEYRWAHDVCLDDHALFYAEVFGDVPAEDVDFPDGG